MAADSEVLPSDPPCTDCNDTGWAFQTEKFCTCVVGEMARESTPIAGAPKEPLDGYDLLVSDLGTLAGVRDYIGTDFGEPMRVLVYLDDGRRFMLTAEEQA